MTQTAEEMRAAIRLRMDAAGMAMNRDASEEFSAGMVGWLLAQVERLERENFALAANQCHDGYGDDYGNHRCKKQDELRAELCDFAARVAMIDEAEFANSSLVRLLAGCDERIARLCGQLAVAEVALEPFAAEYANYDKERPDSLLIELQVHLADLRRCSVALAAIRGKTQRGQLDNPHD